MTCVLLDYSQPFYIAVVKNDTAEAYCDLEYTFVQFGLSLFFFMYKVLWQLSYAAMMRVISH